ncbi:unnamed protein product [Cuscuta campestris]|uniref:Uncharacterized protein n=1 Tax=Cuscuta campestris TaxID=132261 RepID=A0A484N6D6_9ASTE|nr:unnamed protein product [Cuscuta campestris]
MENSSTPDSTMHLHEDDEEIGQIGQLIHKYRSLQVKATSGAEDSSTNNGTVHVRESHTRLAAQIKKRIDRFLAFNPHQDRLLSGVSGNAKTSMTASFKAEPDCGLSIGANSEAEDVTIYFRLYSGRRNCGSFLNPHTDYEIKWYSISTQRMSVSEDGEDRHIHPAIHDEPGSPYFNVFGWLPFSVGPYIFTLRGYAETCVRHLFYHDTQDTKGEWIEFPYLPDTRSGYYFFSANDKVYAFGMYEGLSFGCYSFDLKCRDCNELAKGWQSIHPISKELLDWPYGYCIQT